ncbi:hypothetical protein PZA11_007356 [Diplocarpon coronariae]
MIANLVTALALAGAGVSAAPTLVGNLLCRVGNLCSPSAVELPTVDLGYAVHEATFNDTGRYYNFSNIRYGDAPVRNLRFGAPVAPTSLRRKVNKGQKGAVCPQATPYWPAIAGQFLAGANSSMLEAANSLLQLGKDSLTIESMGHSSPPDPRQSEDCLFLDVVVPQEIFDQKRSAPVLVWVHGGGFVNGDKTSAGNPASLIAQSQLDKGEGVIFVAMNYRLGLFGFLSGSKFHGQGGVSNAGLLDQRLAFEWVQKNIFLFGGDPERITVMGESAGGSSIMHHITAYGGNKGPVPFSQAIMQSPGFNPIAGDAQQVAIFDSVVAQARALISPELSDLRSFGMISSPVLAALNQIVVARSAPYGTFTFGPTVDGTYVPELPAALLQKGAYDGNVKIMVSHNSAEGLFFASPLISTEAQLAKYVRETIPTADNATVRQLLHDVYPPVYDGSYGYRNSLGRLSLLLEEVSFTCNTRYLNLAFRNEGYAYYFQVPPGLHGADISYTFFNGDTTPLIPGGLPVQPKIATAMQRYITNFVMSPRGDPNGRNLPFFPKYQSNSTNLVIDAEKVGALMTDTTANERCSWLLQNLFLKKS